MPPAGSPRSKPSRANDAADGSRTPASSGPPPSSIAALLLLRRPEHSHRPLLRSAFRASHRRNRASPDRSKFAVPGITRTTRNFPPPFDTSAPRLRADTRPPIPLPDPSATLPAPSRSAPQAAPAGSSAAPSFGPCLPRRSAAKTSRPSQSHGLIDDCRLRIFDF